MEMQTAYLAFRYEEDLVGHFPLVFKNEQSAIKWCVENIEYQYTECKLIV